MSKDDRVNADHLRAAELIEKFGPFLRDPDSWLSSADAMRNGAKGRVEHRFVPEALAATRLEALQAQPAGMVPWAGGEDAPNDWDGGRVLVRSQQECPGESVFRWDHQGFGDDVIAYTPKRAALTASPPVVAITPGVNCPNCGHRLPVGYSGPCVACDAPNVFDLPGAPVVEREALRAFARRLDGVPDDTPDIAYLGVEMTHGEGRSVRGAIDAILALTPVEGVGETTQEQCAKVAERIAECANTSGRSGCCETTGDDIAAAIRARS